jgi:hypothetical protein
MGLTIGRVQIAQDRFHLFSLPEPVFDQTNQQNMLEHMDTPSGAATGTVPELQEGPPDLTFDPSSFPDYSGYLNDGPPTSPATAFIDDYLTPPSPQGQLGFQGQQPSPIVPPAAAPLPEVVPVPATGMTTGTTPKPRSPRRSRSPPNPHRLIAPNTPAEEGIARPMDDSTTQLNNSTRAQTSDARAEEEVNDVPTKGPLQVRKDTIAAKKRADKARQTRTKSPTATNKTVKRARRARPEPGAMTISPDSQRNQMPTNEEETETESDAAILRRRKNNSEASSSSDQGPSQPKRPVGRSAAKALTEEAYRKAYDAIPNKSKIVSHRDRPEGIGSREDFQKYIKTRKAVEGVGTIKDTRDAALSAIYDDDPSALQSHVKDMSAKYNSNPNHADIPITQSIVRHHKAEYKKRKQTEPASNPRSNAKDQTKRNERNN